MAAEIDDVAVRLPVTPWAGQQRHLTLDMSRRVSEQARHVLQTALDSRSGHVVHAAWAASQGKPPPLPPVSPR